jgi:hypothetical protein
MLTYSDLPLIPTQVIGSHGFRAPILMISLLIGARRSVVSWAYTVERVRRQFRRAFLWGLRRPIVCSHHAAREPGLCGVTIF